MQTTPMAIPRSKRDIEENANFIRKLFNCNGYYFDIITFLENVIPQIDPTFNYCYVEESEMPNRTYAFYDPEKNTLKMSSTVYDGAVNDNGRDRFTIAHEIGHYFLHRSGIRLARSMDVPRYCDPEWQANVFASFLLIPRDLTKFLTISEIQSKCKVSYQAAEIACKRNWQ